MKTQIADFLSELGAGAFQPKLEHVLSEAALKAITHGRNGKKAKITIEFTISQVGDNEQVIVSHKIGSILPTHRGKRSEEDTTETPFFVGKGGVMTIAPPKEDDNGQFSLVNTD